MALSRLDPIHCLRWNIVPWALLGPQGRRRASRIDDLENVVAFGKAPLEGWMRYLTLTDEPVLPTLAVPHPSPAKGRRRQEALQCTIAALDRAAGHAGQPSGDASRLERVAIS